VLQFGISDIVQIACNFTVLSLEMQEALGKGLFYRSEHLSGLWPSIQSIGV